MSLPRPSNPTPQARFLSRRALILGGAGFVTAAAAGSAWAATRGSSTPDSLPGASTGPPTPLPQPSSAPQGVPNGVEQPSGRATLYSARRLSFDALDAARTGERSVLEVLGRTHSRLVTWVDTAGAAIDGDLATGWELADEATWVFQMREDADWHARPGLEQRPFVADDALDHLERVISLARDGRLQQVQRPLAYAAIESVEAPDDHTLVVRTTRPYPHLLPMLAGPFALIQRPEVVPLLEADGNEIVPEHVSGTGPFRFDGRNGDGSLEFRAAANPPRGPRLADLRVVPASDNLDAFLARRFDEYVTHDRRDASELRSLANGGDVMETGVLDASPVVSSMHVGSPPWNDENLRLALSGALNRTELALRLFGGRARPSGHITPAQTAFVLPEDTLAQFPGYQASFEDDARDARARWEAAAGDALGRLTIDFPSIFDPLYSASSVVPGMLREVLGVDVEPRVDSYVNIADRAANGDYGNSSFALWFGWAPALTSPDPSQSLIEAYASDSVASLETGFESSEVDGILAVLDTAFNIDERAAGARELESALLSSAMGGVIPWLQQEHEHFRWAYLLGPPPTPFETQHLSAITSVDETHPRYPPERRT